MTKEVCKLTRACERRKVIIAIEALDIFCEQNSSIRKV